MYIWYSLKKLLDNFSSILLTVFEKLQHSYSVLVVTTACDTFVVNSLSQTIRH